MKSRTMKSYLIAVLVAVLATSSAYCTVVDIPLQTAEECGATLQNSTSELIIAFSPCLASSGASEECCRALEDTFSFANEKFGGCKYSAKCDLSFSPFGLDDYSFVY